MWREQSHASSTIRLPSLTRLLLATDADSYAQEVCTTQDFNKQPTSHAREEEGRLSMEPGVQNSERERRLCHHLRH